jgi:hypothetical protein
MKIVLIILMLWMANNPIQNQSEIGVQKHHNRTYLDVFNSSYETEPSITVEFIDDPACKLHMYHPKQLNINLVNKRPVFNQSTYMVVPAAYTDKQNRIDGLCFLNGNKVASNINTNLTGFCMLRNNTIEIKPLKELTPTLQQSIVTNKATLFQQSLLVLNGQLIPCNLFGNTRNKRRALVKFKNSYCIAESVNPLAIADFQKALIKIKAISAFNLDMGSWSEGWYKNKQGNQVKIGDYMSSTSQQTNWLVLSK